MTYKIYDQTVEDQNGGNIVKVVEIAILETCINRCKSVKNSGMSTHMTFYPMLNKFKL